MIVHRLNEIEINWEKRKNWKNSADDLVIFHWNIWNENEMAMA